MADLPESDWITLSESHSRAVQAFDAKPSAVEKGLVAAFHDWKIRTRGRCLSYFRHDTLLNLDKGTWDRAGVIWRASEFAIPGDRYGLHKIHVFSDVEVHRKDFKEWINGPADVTNLSREASRKGGSKPKYYKGLQEFLNTLFMKFDEAGKPFTLSTLEDWLSKNAPQDEPYQSGVPDCDHIELIDDAVHWIDHKGHLHILKTCSLDPYIKRAKTS